MNILLIRPKPEKESIGLQSFMICEPLELEYISSYLESFGHKVSIIDMIVEKKSLAYFIKKFKPDFAGFTAYITHVNVVKKYARIVKRIDSRIITIVGGIHAEVNPGDFDDPAIDFISYVNGLKTFKEIIDSIDKGKEYIKANVNGVYYGPGKSYFFEKNFNYPHPDRDKTKQYRDKYNYIFHNKCAILKTSFGCAYTCEFCYCREITRHTYFERPLEDVLSEIKKINEENIFIVDDDFLFKPERVTNFCRLLKEHGIKKHFILFGRADFVVNNEDVIALFKGMGLQALFIGLESFREDDLINMKKKISVSQNVEAVRILEKHGIEVHSGIILNPDWDKKDFDHLVKWLNSFKMIFVNIQPLTPMPGTALYDKLQNAIDVPRGQYAKWDMAHLVLKPSKMSRREFYQNIMRTYYKTSTSAKAHRYILFKYGLKTYIRTLWGSLYITGQYWKMFLRG